MLNHEDSVEKNSIPLFQRKRVMLKRFSRWLLWIKWRNMFSGNFESPHRRRFSSYQNNKWSSNKSLGLIAKSKKQIKSPSPTKRPDSKPRECMSPWLKKLMDYSIVPSQQTQQKMDFYYAPYNKTLEWDKYMRFEPNE